MSALSAASLEVMLMIVRRMPESSGCALAARLLWRQGVSSGTAQAQTRTRPVEGDCLRCHFQGGKPIVDNERCKVRAG